MQRSLEKGMAENAGVVVNNSTVKRSPFRQDKILKYPHNVQYYLALKSIRTMLEVLRRNREKTKAKGVVFLFDTTSADGLTFHYQKAKTYIGRQVVSNTNLTKNNY